MVQMRAFYLVLKIGIKKGEGWELLLVWLNKIVICLILFT